MPTVHVFDYLASPNKYPASELCVLFGDDAFLKQQALHKVRDEVTAGDADAPFTTFSGESAEWRDVIDEISTVALFGSNGRRLAVVDAADDFVSSHRQRLEDYLARPKAKSVLVLVVDTWPSNTRLFKGVDQSGLQIDCGPPVKAGSKNKSLDHTRTQKWLIAWSESRHDAVLQSLSAEVLLDLVGPNFGLLDQSIAKLALFAGTGGKITAEMVQDIVGGWRAKTTWDLVDAVAEGDVPDSFLQLDRLLHSGVSPLELLGAIAWSLRRFATATRIYEQGERDGRRQKLQDVLLQAGFRKWPVDALSRAEKQLMQLGRERTGRLLRWLVDIDLALKGSHSSPERSRAILENLFVRMSKELAPRKHGAKAVAARIKG